MGRNSTIKVGDVFGKLKVLEVLKSSGAGSHSKILCKCECGNEKKISSHLLKSKIKSCGCSKNSYENIVGNVYGKITVSNLHSEIKNKHSIKRNYMCLCNNCRKQYIYSDYVIKRKGFIGCRCSDNISTKKYVFSNYKRNACKKNRSFNITFEQFVYLCEKECYYCGSKPSNFLDIKSLYGNWKYNGIDRIDNEKGYDMGNVVSCCKTCNMMKRDMKLEDFLSSIKSIFNNQFPNISEALGWRNDYGS